MYLGQKVLAMEIEIYAIFHVFRIFIKFDLFPNQQILIWEYVRKSENTYK